jgi:hypothetical protein
MKVKENIKTVYKLGDRSYGWHDETYETYEDACAALDAIVDEWIENQIIIVSYHLEQKYQYDDYKPTEDEIREIAENEIRDFHSIDEVQTIDGKVSE